MTKAELEREIKLANAAWEGLVKTMNEPGGAVSLNDSSMPEGDALLSKDASRTIDPEKLIGTRASAMDKILNQV